MDNHNWGVSHNPNRWSRIPGRYSPSPTPPSKTVSAFSRQDELPKCQTPPPNSITSIPNTHPPPSMPRFPKISRKVPHNIPSMQRRPHHPENEPGTCILDTFSNQIIIFHWSPRAQRLRDFRTLLNIQISNPNSTCTFTDGSMPKGIQTHNAAGAFAAYKGENDPIFHELFQIGKTFASDAELHAFAAAIRWAVINANSNELWFYTDSYYPSAHAPLPGIGCPKTHYEAATCRGAQLTAISPKMILWAR
ncbi:hypothetical protein BD779DRAFT_1241703 [Infundibulicybe gibba]|nr:hypothetical protein BD779DRAFT_1241703 [Infundibulicybe gibba]